MIAYDIEISRHGTWKVYVGDTLYSSHNEEKEGYENMVEAKLNNMSMDVTLRPEFYASINITMKDVLTGDTVAPDTLTITDITEQ